MPITTEQRDELLAAAKKWDEVADDELKMMELDAAAGHNTQANRNRLSTYRRTAESLRREADTGVAHCSCCVKPYDKCDRRPRGR